MEPLALQGQLRALPGRAREPAAPLRSRLALRAALLAAPQVLAQAQLEEEQEETPAQEPQRVEVRLAVQARVVAVSSLCLQFSEGHHSGEAAEALSLHSRKIWAKRAALIGFTRWRSNPASSERERSSGWP